MVSFTVCVARMQQGLNLSSEMPAVEVAALECCAAVAGSDVEEAEPFAILDVEFFDDEQLVMVYRPRNAGECLGARRPQRRGVHRRRERKG